MKDLDRLLRDALNAQASAYEPRNVDEAESLFMRKRGRRRLLRTGGAGLVAASAAAVAVFALVQPEVVNDREIRPQPAALQVAERFPVAEEPLAIAGAPSGVWIASREGGTVTRIDPATGDTEEVLLEEASQVVTAGDVAWAAGPRNVIEIEPGSGSGTAIIDFPPDVVDMAGSGPGRPVWLVTSSGCVADVTAMEGDICRGPEEFHATDVATSGTETWILDGATGDLHQLHAELGVNEGRGVVDGDAPLATAPAGRYADLLLSTVGGRDILWASGEAGHLLRLDLETGEASTFDLPGDYIDLAEGYDGVWALVGHEGSDRGELVAIDVATGKPTGDPYPLSGKPSDVYAGIDGIWVTLRESNEVVHIVKPDTEPVPVETAEPTPPPDENEKERGRAAAIVFSKGGDIWSANEDGAIIQLTDTPEAELYPVFTKSIFDPRGQAILFQRGRDTRDGTQDLFYLDLSTREESRISEGSWATFYPDGTGAWLSRAGSQPEIVVAPLFSEPILSFAVVGTSDPASVGPVAWDQERQRLFYAVAERNGPEIYSAEVFDAGGSPRDEIEPQLLDVDNLDEGDVLVAPTVSFSDGVDVLRLFEPSPSPDDGSYGGVELGTVDTSGARPVYKPLVDLSHLPFGMDVATARMTLANAGELAADVRADGTVEWSRGQSQSWLVGDHFRSFLVDAGGGIQELPFEAGPGASVSFDYLPRD